jgi:uncharacterized protein with WD repeat
LKWDEGETICGRLVSNEVQFFDGHFSSKDIVARLKLPDVQKFAISPGHNLRLATFVPEKKVSE